MAVAPARDQPAGRSLRLSPLSIAALLLALALVSWVVTFDRMRGMDAGPGTDLGGLGWFIGIWVTMMAAMMLPSVSPMVLAFARVTKERSSRGQAAFVPTWVFLGGYLAAWTAYGLARLRPLPGHRRARRRRARVGPRGAVRRGRSDRRGRASTS